MFSTQEECKRLWIGRLRYGVDLLEEVTGLCKKENIRSGWLTGLGAVQKAHIGYYNQESREYQYFAIDQPLEITNLTGNISIRDNSPMVHVHITLADATGKSYGGHLAPGTIVFACELKIEILNGLVLERKYDEKTGLTLWPAG